jgi:uncharacterized protein with HEPN domain
MLDDASTVLDIVLACRRIVRFVADMDEVSFLVDERTQWAVASQLTLIGEAAKRLTDEIRDQQASVPWPKIMGMRNRLVHHYDKIDWPLVWTTARRDVPSLLAKLEPLVPEEEDGDPGA